LAFGWFALALVCSDLDSECFGLFLGNGRRQWPKRTLSDHLSTDFDAAALWLANAELLSRAKSAPAPGQKTRNRNPRTEIPPGGPGKTKIFDSVSAAVN